MDATEGTRSLVKTLFSGMAGDARLDGSEMAAHMPTLHTLASFWAWGHVVEVGVGRGWSAVSLLSSLVHQGRKLISYDIDGARRGVAIKNWGMKENDPTLGSWDFRVKSSVEAAGDFQDASISLFFLDTSHTYDATKAELKAWLPKIHPNGVICGHDYFLYQRPDWAKLSGVHVAVDEFARDHKDRFRLQVLPHDQGLFILWPRSVMG